MNRRDRQKAETLREIMRSAEELFVDQGYERTSVHQIAERSGLTKGALYHHFDSKEALLDRMCADHYRVMSDAADAAIADGKLPCLERLRRVMETARDSGVSQVSFVSEYLKVRRGEGNGMLRERLRKYERDFYVSFAGPLLREAREQGECGFASSPETLALFLYQICRGVDEEIRRVFAEESGDRAENLIVDILKTYVYTLSRLLNMEIEKVSVLIDLEKTLHFYRELLRKKQG
jgi:AcrR family transcriptional regulator